MLCLVHKNAGCKPNSWTYIKSSKTIIYLLIYVSSTNRTFGITFHFTLSIPLICYYIFIGGTFALYSLICRYAKVGLIPNQQAEDREVSNFQLELPSSSQRIASMVKAKLEKSHFAKFFLLFATMLGTSMVIGDGVLTPCISGMLIFYILLLLHYNSLN